MIKTKSANNVEDISKARALRRDASPFESKVWDILRLNGKAFGLKFRRQQPLHPYIADFACMEADLLIEIDGPSHDASRDKDLKREKHLRNEGFEILRFSNADVRNDVQAVVDTVLAIASDRVAKKRNA